MPKTVRTFRFPATVVMLVVAIFVLLAASIWDINFIEMPFGFMNRIEQSEIDEVITAFLLVIVAFIFDQAIASRRAKQQAKLEAERLRVLRVTMRTVQDLVNNCLNQLQLLRLDAEGHVPEETLTLFDETIHETSARLKELADLDVFAEQPMAIGQGLDSGQAS